jgi:hypothetical protein
MDWITSQREDLEPYLGYHQFPVFIEVRSLKRGEISFSICRREDQSNVWGIKQLVPSNLRSCQDGFEFNTNDHLSSDQRPPDVITFEPLRKSHYQTICKVFEQPTPAS